MKNIWTILCQSSAIDNRTNQLSAFNLIEGMTFIRPKSKEAEKHFIAPITFQLISFWICENENDKADVKIKTLDPDNQIVNEFDVVVHPVDKKLKIRNIIDFGAFKVTKAGNYTIVLMIGNKDKNDFKVISEIPVDIKVEYRDQNKE